MFWLVTAAAGRGRAAGAAATAAEILTARALGHESGSYALGLAFTGRAFRRIHRLAHRTQQIEFLTAIHATVFVDRHNSLVSYIYYCNTKTPERQFSDAIGKNRITGKSHKFMIGSARAGLGGD